MLFITASFTRSTCIHLVKYVKIQGFITRNNRVPSHSSIQHSRTATQSCDNMYIWTIHPYKLCQPTKTAWIRWFVNLKQFRRRIRCSIIQSPSHPYLDSMQYNSPRFPRIRKSHPGSAHQNKSTLTSMTKIFRIFVQCFHLTRQPPVLVETLRKPPRTLITFVFPFPVVMTTNRPESIKPTSLPRRRCCSIPCGDSPLLQSSTNPFFRYIFSISTPKRSFNGLEQVTAFHCCYAVLGSPCLFLRLVLSRSMGCPGPDLLSCDFDPTLCPSRNRGSIGGHFFFGSNRIEVYTNFW